MKWERKTRKWMLLGTFSLLILLAVLWLTAGQPVEEATARSAVAAPAALPGQPIHLTKAHVNQHPWPMAGREQLRSGYSGSGGPRFTPIFPEPWPFTADGLLPALPVVGSEGTVYVGADSGTFFALQESATTDTRLQRWSVPTGDPIRSAAALKQEVAAAGAAGDVRVFFTTIYGDVYGVDADTGQVAWVETLGASVSGTSSPVVRTNPETGLASIYLATNNGIYLLQEEAGSGGLPGVREEWHNFSTPTPNAVALSPGGGLLYATVSSSLYVLDTGSGALLCDFDLGAPLSPPVVHPDGAIFLGTGSGELWQMRVQTSPACTFNFDSLALGGAVSLAPALGPAGAVVAVAGQDLVGVDWSKGQVVWRETNIEAQPYPPIVDAYGIAFVGRNDGSVKAFAPDGVQLWQKQVVSSGSPLAVGALDNSGRLYLSGEVQVHVIMADPAYQIAYEAAIPSGDQDVHVRAREVTANSTRWAVTDHPQDEGQPAYSLDGRQMAFVSNRAGTKDVFLANSAGRDARNLTNIFPFSGTNEIDPAFSPVNRAGHSLLPSGGPALALTQVVSQGQELHFFDLKHYEETGNLAFQNLAGWFHQEVGSNPEYKPYQAQAAFSPDGGRIAYSTCYGTAGERMEELVVVDLQAAALTRTVVISDFIGSGGDCSSLIGYHPSFSPDGRYLAYQNSDSGQLSIYDIALDKHHPFLPYGGFPDNVRGRHPTWSPDGAWIAYAGFDTASNDAAIYIQKIYLQRGDKVDQVTNPAHPAFRPLLLPEPDLQNECGFDSLTPEAAQPSTPIQIDGCGLDIFYPQRTQVAFTTIGGGTAPAGVQAAQVDYDLTGYGALTVPVPAMAGDGPVTVATPFGHANSEPFTVIPRPLLLEPDQARRLETIRVIGLGMMQAGDPALSSPLQNQVYFTNKDGQMVEEATITAAGLEPCGSAAFPCPSGQSEAQWLDVMVPPDAVSGTVAVDNADGDRGLTPNDFQLVRTPVDLRVTLEEEPVCDLLVGGSGRYVYKIFNDGPNASAQTTFEVGVPGSKAAFSASTTNGSCQTLRNRVSCDLGEILSGRAALVSVTVTPTKSALVTNRATASNVFLDTDSSNNTISPTLRFRNVATSSLDVAVADVEVTQGLQDMSQSIQLIGNKETMVRVYLDTGGVPVREIPVLLYESSNGNPFGAPIRPEIRGGGSCYAQPGGPRQRHRSDNSVNFRLPGHAITGTFEFTVMVDENGILPETDRSNNTATRSLQYYSAPNICLVTYRMRHSGDDGNPANDVTVVNQTFPIAMTGENYLLQNSEFLTRATSVLPTANLHVIPHSDVIFPRLTPLRPFYEIGRRPKLDRSRAMARVARKWTNSLAPGVCANKRWPTHYLGMLHPKAKTGDLQGLARTPGRALYVRFVNWNSDFGSPYGGLTLAHELGHNYNREHVNCPAGQPDDLDPNYPYPGCDFGPDDADAYFGVDLTRPIYASHTVISPTDTYGKKEVSDMMSYTDYQWSSDYTWNAIYNELPGTVNVTAPPASGETVTDVYQVTGYITGTDTLSESVLFNPVYHVDTEIMPPEKMAAALDSQPAGASYRLNLLGEEDALLESAYFTPTVASDITGTVPYRAFDLVLPYQPGGNRFQLLHEGEEIGSLPISPEPPTVTVTYPEGGQVGETMEVGWQAHDPDGDELYYMVQFSADGGARWETLAMDLISPTLRISTSYLSGNEDPLGLVRVVASDGANTAHDVSDSTFQLPLHAPEVYVNRPEAGATVAKSRVALYGTAYDAEDGPMSDDLFWYVEGPALPDGRSGAGRQLRLTGLTPGTYSVTLETIDEHGMVGGDFRTFTVAACVAPDAPRPALRLDGNDAILTWALADSHRSYVVYRSDAPYFDPDTATEIGTTVENFYRMSGGADSTAYYYVEALGCDGHSAVTPAGQRGTFSFNLVPGG